MSNLKSDRRENKLGLILLGSAIIISAMVIFTIDFGNKPVTQENILVETENATLLRTPRPLTSFKLTSHHKKPYTEQSLKGQWTLLSFGYTHCPDVCPTALATLSQMDDQLKKDKVTFPYQIVFVSVDPERDTLERLAEYVPYFNPSFIGVTGEIEQISNFTRQVGIMYAKAEQIDSAMGYGVDHSASFVLINPKGEFHAVMSSPHQPMVLSKDWQAIANAGK